MKRHVHTLLFVALMLLLAACGTERLRRVLLPKSEASLPDTTLLYSDFCSFRNNGNAFNTDLSEGKFSPIYDVNGVLLGTTKEGFTGQVLVYEGLEDIDFSSLSEREALLYEGVDSYDNIRNSLSEEARSNIWTNIVSHFEGLRVYDETFSMEDLANHKVGFGSKLGASWVTSWENGSNKGDISGTDGYSYETTVENIASSIIVHEWYSHIQKDNQDSFKSHRLAYKNVINYKPLWKKTTDAYQRFNLGALRFYTRKETGRSMVDPPYRRIYNKCYGKACWGNPVDDMIMQAIIVNDTTPFSQLPYGIDSLVIIYWAGTKAMEYIITIPNMLKTSLKEGFSDARQSIDSPCLTRSIMSYLQSFYIDETIPIIVSKRRREFVVSGDYSCLSIKAYKKGKCIMSKDTQMGEERYDVIYHPDFIVLWNLLNELVDEFDGRKP